MAPHRELTDYDRDALNLLGEDWRFFKHIASGRHGLSRRQLANRLRSLKARGYVDTRVNDIYGLTEYALTEKGWNA